MIKVLTFGTFDGVHDGHRSMLREAKSLADYLIVAVAPDSVVGKLKGTVVRTHNSGERIEFVKDERIADEVVLADEKIGSWKILKKYKPNVIALGYDQDELRADLEIYLEKTYPDVETEEGFQSNPKKPRIVRLAAHKPKELHNRIMNKE